MIEWDKELGWFIKKRVPACCWFSVFGGFIGPH